MDALKFYLNDIPLSEYGISVLKAIGLLGSLKPKQRKNESWDNSHGRMYDRSKLYFDEKKFSLQCCIIQPDRYQYFAKLNNFVAALATGGAKQLKIEISADVVLILNVLLEEEFDATPAWNGSKVFANFTVKLVDAEPIKVVCKAMHATTTLSFSSTKLMNVYFADGTTYYDKSGDVSISQATAVGSYFTVCGDIDGIGALSTNAMIVSRHTNRITIDGKLLKLNNKYLKY